MNFGFLGIQFGFGLQQANMSPIYRYLGADEAQIPWLWLAGPLTGLLVQPIIGAMSDKTWTKLGRRRPYFLVGAILASIALIFMPYSSTLWMAAGLLWILDASMNVAMEPFRAFIADKLPGEQRSLGFSVQSFFVGLGQFSANIMPWLLGFLGIITLGAYGAIAELEDSNGIPNFIKYSFVLGAAVMLGTVLWTIFTTDEFPPEDIEKLKKEKVGIASVLKEVKEAIISMPKTMKQLWWVMFFVWYGLPLMWQYLSLAIARHVFDAASPAHPDFEKGAFYGGISLAIFSVACFTISFAIPWIGKKLGHRLTHAVFLAIGAIGFLTMQIATTTNMFYLCMFLVGMAWASIMAVPYVILSFSVPKDRMGVYMGIFNMFIVVPQFISMATVPFYYDALFLGDPRNALAFVGVCFILGAISCFFISKDYAKIQVD
ncbi:MFS transporter [Arenibacter sp. M-2]|uniref:MFS transporter n=1 Tax=Arenibacter sp. M-2 TaxID=3053612 RepID=UPI002570C678|nr:MFS transporter [Arenibacter sp. M-2]MDL5513491.1 MFS transporter [Arenibacter sp. M-2]